MYLKAITDNTLIRLLGKLKGNMYQSCYNKRKIIKRLGTVSSFIQQI